MANRRWVANLIKKRKKELIVGSSHIFDRALRVELQALEEIASVCNYFDRIVLSFLKQEIKDQQRKTNVLYTQDSTLALIVSES